MSTLMSSPTGIGLLPIRAMGGWCVAVEEICGACPRAGARVGLAKRQLEVAVASRSNPSDVGSKPFDELKDLREDFTANIEAPRLLVAHHATGR